MVAPVPYRNSKLTHFLKVGLVDASFCVRWRNSAFMQLRYGTSSLLQLLIVCVCLAWLRECLFATRKSKKSVSGVLCRAEPYGYRRERRFGKCSPLCLLPPSLLQGAAGLQFAL